MSAKFDSKETPELLEIDLLDAAKILYNGKLFLFVFTSMFSCLTVWYSLSLPDIYKASAIYVSAESSSSSIVASGGLAGIASLAGVNLGGGDSSKTDVAIEIMESWDFIESFISKYNLEADIVAAIGWDKHAKSTLFDEKLYDRSKRALKDGVELSSWHLYQEFLDLLSIAKDKKTGFITISIEHRSPIVAKKILDLLVAEINDYIRAADSKEANNSIKYLKKAASTAEITDMKKLFFGLIEEQLKALMLAEVKQEYVFKTISPAKTPEQKTQPKRSIICIVGGIVGFILAIALVFFRHYLVSSRLKR